MSFPQLGYQYIRPLYPAERPGSGGSRGGAELAPSGTPSNVLSSMYGAPYAAAAAAQGYGAFLPYAAELPIFPQLVRAPPGPGRGGAGSGVLCSPGPARRGRTVPERSAARGPGAPVPSGAPGGSAAAVRRSGSGRSGAVRAPRRLSPPPLPSRCRARSTS